VGDRQVLISDFDTEWMTGCDVAVEAMYFEAELEEEVLALV
jgi:hypothetical protein